MTTDHKPQTGTLAERIEPTIPGFPCINMKHKPVYMVAVDRMHNDPTYERERWQMPDCVARYRCPTCQQEAYGVWRLVAIETRRDGDG